MTRQQINLLVAKYRRRAFIPVGLLALMMVVTDWAMVHYSQGKIAAMNGSNFILIVGMVFLTINGVCSLITKVLADIYADKDTAN
jgi:hypothetical protein